MINGFSGAFGVLHGSSINAEYHFEQTEKMNHHFSFGKLTPTAMSKLHTGSVQSIYSGKRFIHSVFHLQNPTISIVVRTYQDDDAMPQFEYRGKRIRLVEYLSPEFTKKIQALRFTYQTHLKKFETYFKNIFYDLPLDERYWLLRAFFTQLQSIDALWQAIDASDEAHHQAMLKAIHEEELIYRALTERKKIQAPTVKYFLALLINLPCFTDLIQFIHTYEDVPASHFINECLTQLSHLGYKTPEVDCQLLSNTPKPRFNRSYTAKAMSGENIFYHLINQRIFG